MLYWSLLCHQNGSNLLKHGLHRRISGEFGSQVSSVLATAALLCGWIKLISLHSSGASVNLLAVHWLAFLAPCNLVVGSNHYISETRHKACCIGDAQFQTSSQLGKLKTTEASSYGTGFQNIAPTESTLYSDVQSLALRKSLFYISPLPYVTHDLISSGINKVF